MQRREAHFRADLRCGPDDPSLWPQPWIQSFDGGLVDGLADLWRLKLFSLKALMLVWRVGTKTTESLPQSPIIFFYQPVLFPHKREKVPSI